MGLNIRDLEISSPAFSEGGSIPSKYAKDGDDVSPPLAWTGVPDGTRQLALICHDPDAPLPHGWTHWVVYGIEPDATGIPEGGGSGYLEGMNDYGDKRWGGPQPPPGHGTHRYYFWLYALDTELDADPGLSRADLLARIEDHVIEQNRLVGTYEQ